MQAENSLMPAGGLPVPIDGPVFVYYNYHSVPIPQERIDYLVKHVVSKLSLEFDRFFFCCDVRATPKDVVDKAEGIPNCEVSHMSILNSNLMEETICERMKWHAATMDGGHGCIALISDAGDFGPTLSALSRGGWRIAIFHPPKTDSTFLDYADDSFALPIHRTVNDEHVQVPAIADTGIPRVANPDCRIATMAQDVRQGLTHLLSRLSGAMGSLPNTPEAEVNGEEKISSTEIMASGDVQRAAAPMMNDPNMYHGQRQMVSPFMQPQQFVPVYGNPPPYTATEPAPPTLCSRCGIDTAQEQEKMLPPPMAEPRQSPFGERKNPFGQQNPFQQQSRPNPFQQDKRRNDNWKEGDDGFFNKRRQEDEDEDEDGWKMVSGSRPGMGQRNPFAQGGQTQMKGRDLRDQNNNTNNTVMGGDGREKFRKPAAQCPHWEDRNHRVNNNCQLWHPYKLCIFYPQCRSAAADCGYAHPFCSEGDCECDENNRDVQLNHWTGGVRPSAD